MSIETYNRENDLCLLCYDNKYWYIGCLDLPQKSWTVDQYNNWLHKHTPNLIALNDNYVPQILSHYGLKIDSTSDNVCDYWEGHYSNKEPNNTDYDFRKLLLQLLAVTDGNYRKAFYDYFEDFYSVF